MPTLPFDDRAIAWQTIEGFDHAAYHILSVDEEARIVDRDGQPGRGRGRRGNIEQRGAVITVEVVACGQLDMAARREQRGEQRA